MKAPIAAPVTPAEREALAREWADWMASLSEPDTAETYQRAAIAEHASLRIPDND